MVEQVEDRVAMLINAYQQCVAQEDSDSDIAVVEMPQFWNRIPFWKPLPMLVRFAMTIHLALVNLLNFSLKVRAA